MAKKVLVRCPGCKYKTKISRLELEVRMLCPNCHGQHLKRPEKLRKENAILRFRPETDRMLMSGMACFLLGAIGFVASLYKMMTTQGESWGRMVLFTGLFALVGAGILISGVVRHINEEAE